MFKEAIQVCGYHRGNERSDGTGTLKSHEVITMTEDRIDRVATKHGNNNFNMETWHHIPGMTLDERSGKLFYTFLCIT